jgi:hypothetical protein
MLSPFGLEVSFRVFPGRAKEYFVFNYTSSPACFSDDKPEYIKYFIQVHLVTPPNVNLEKLKSSVTEAIYRADFLYPSCEDAGDEDQQHVVWETEATEVILYGKD